MGWWFIANFKINSPLFCTIAAADCIIGGGTIKSSRPVDNISRVPLYILILKHNESSPSRNSHELKLFYGVYNQ